MATNACDRCGKDFVTKSHLVEHLFRKKQCPPSKSDVDVRLQIDRQRYRRTTHACPNCDKEFLASKTLKYHVDHNVCRQRQQPLTNQIPAVVNINLNFTTHIPLPITEPLPLPLPEPLPITETETEPLPEPDVNVSPYINFIGALYIYIVIIREFINSKQEVYKIGYTKDIFQRMKGYPKGSKLLFITIVGCDGVLIESKIKKELGTKFKARTDCGTEYFEGDFGAIRKSVLEICVGSQDFLSIKC